MTPPTTRFAPSPTGSLHIGGARTALFNWLFARRHGGRFVLRIEDTDRARNTPEAVRAILEGLEWLGIRWEGEPAYQSRRGDLYRSRVEQLLGSGHAYRREGAVRFRMPRDPIRIPDLVAGEVVRDLTDREREDPDFVIVRSDGQPVFHLVNVVDDLEGGITHVIRGEDHLSNTARHLALFQALGHPPPRYAHIPLILNPGGSKMSKRDEGSSLEAYRRESYLPEALANYLCLLGWSPGGDREILSMEELAGMFDLSRIQRANARFDPEKLRWLHGEHLARLDPERYRELAARALEARGLALSDRPPGYVARALDTTRGKTRTLGELEEYAGFYFQPASRIRPDPEAAGRHLKPENREGALRMRQALAALGSFDPDSVQQCFRATAREMGTKVKALVHPVRLACTGSTAGPGLWELISILGRDEALRRLDQVLARMEE